jgi:hypothetical protein
MGKSGLGGELPVAFFFFEMLGGACAGDVVDLETPAP